MVVIGTLRTDIGKSSFNKTVNAGDAQGFPKSSSNEVSNKVIVQLIFGPSYTKTTDQQKYKERLVFK